MPDIPPALEPAAPQQRPSPSLAARMFNVFAAPGEVFDSIKNTPPAHANWLVPALTLLVVSWLGAWLIFSDAAIRQQMRELSEKAIDQQIARQHMTETQAEEARKAAGKFADLGPMLGAVVGPVVVAFVTPFLLGLLFWVIANHALKTSLPYLKAVEVVGLAAMISVLEAIVRTFLIVITERPTASLSPVLFIKDFDPANALHSLSVFANPLVIWLLLVRAIALAAVTGRSFRKAAGWVFGLWLGYTGLMWATGWMAQHAARKLGG